MDHEPVRVAIVAPQLTCWSLTHLLGMSPSLTVSASSFSLAGWREIPVAQACFDVMVLDIDHCATHDELKHYLTERPVRVVALTGAKEATSLDSLVLLGLQGIVHKHDAPSALPNAVERVHGGEFWLERRTMSRIFMEVARRRSLQPDDTERAKIALLTEREREMITALAMYTDAPGKVIAERLQISEHTLRNHLTSIYSKLKLRNRMDLYAFATRHKLDRPPA
jgi:DNA-binding NarL/FixJ family response regulator